MFGLQAAVSDFYQISHIIIIRLNRPAKPTSPF